jgi:hypothetical protein
MANYGTAGLGDSVAGDVTFHFCYQATADFTVKVNTGDGATITATYEKLGSSPPVTVSSTGTAITFPPATFAYATIEVTGGTSTYLS